MRYPTDLTNAQWEVIEPLLPPAKKEGRRRTVDRRAVLNAIFYLLRTGCAWRMLPHDFPPYKSVYTCFSRWKQAGVWEQVHDALVTKVRKKAGKAATPSAVSIDSQSVKTTEKGGSRAMIRARKLKDENDTLLLIHLG
jgi:putative transposase